MGTFRELLLKNSSPKKTILKNIFWLCVSQLSRLLRIATLLFAARLLGASEYGVFSYIVGFVALFTLFSDLGVNALLTRDVAGDEKRQREYFVTSFWIKLGLIAATCVLLLGTSPYLVKIPAALYLLPLAALLLIFDNVRDCIISYFRGMEQMEKETLLVVILNTILAIFGFVTLLFYPSTAYLFTAYVISSGVATCISLAIAYPLLRYLFSSFRKRIARDIFKNGWPIALSSTFGILMLNLDVAMLGFWRSASEIGLYSAGQKLVQVLYSLPMLIASGIFPTLSAMVRSGDIEKERRLNEHSVSALFLFTLPLVIGGIILAQPVIALVFGSGYAAGASAFAVLLLSALFLFPGVVFANLVLAHNLQKYTLRYAIIGSLINAGLNSLLIPAIGIVGAALATLLAQATYYTCIWRKIRTVAYFSTFSRIKKILAAAIIMGGITFLLSRLSVPALLNILLSAGAYIGLLLLFKERLLYSQLAVLKHLRLRRIDQDPVH